MTKETAIKLFNEKHIRTQWDNDNENGTFLLLMLLQFLRKAKILIIIGKYLKTDLKRREVSWLQIVTN